MSAAQDVVWITGASSGIGRALARNLARRGRTIAASARDAAELRALAEEARDDAGSIHPFALDITDAGQCAATVGTITATLGPIALAVLNAGTHHPVAAETFEAADFARLIEVNLIGTGNCLAPLLQRMIPARAGHIAIVASVAGYRGLPTSAYYGASKAALINLAEALKFDLDRHGIRLQLINPGFVRTPLTDKNAFPMPFLMEVEVAAERMADGFERHAFEITFPRRFAWSLKLLRILPYRLYFPIVSRMTGT
ncbi:MAG: SDR family NAD(P)-dependent oxidoreductase [Rhizobiales bacterium]|nr:SDR family NAD(P)-dependent oxidoreductase [Hyphomicrobiales bacterium]